MSADADVDSEFGDDLDFDDEDEFDEFDDGNEHDEFDDEHDEFDDEEVPEGIGLINIAWSATAAFVGISAVAVVFPDSAATPAAAVDVVLFLAGIVTFVWGFVVGVDRSRTEQIEIVSLFFLSNGAAPRSARRRLIIPLVIQIVVAFAAALLRPYTPLAFGLLVPMFGLGILALWGSRHGIFPLRDEEDR